MPTNTSSPNIVVLLRDIKFEFPLLYFKNSAYQIYVDWYWSYIVPTLTLQLRAPSQFSKVSNNQVRHTVIIMDTVGISNTYTGYVFSGNMYYYMIPSAYIPLPFPAITHPTIYFGLSLFYLNLPGSDPSLAFSTAQNGNQINVASTSTGSSYSFFISFAAFPYFVCNDSLFPTFDPSTLNCTSVTCAATFRYYNLTTKSC